MPDSDIMVTALELTPGVGSNLAKFTVDDPNVGGLPYLGLDVIELHAASVNDRSLAVLVDEGRDKAIHMDLAQGATYYYWTRPRNKSIGYGGLRYYGDWFPLSPTGGIESAVFADDNVWMDWTPTITAASGTFTTVSTPYARYKVIGKICFFQLNITITTNGTAAGWINFTLPITSSVDNRSLALGLRGSGAFDACTALIEDSATYAEVRKYDSFYPGGDGRQILIAGQYEV